MMHYTPSLIIGTLRFQQGSIGTAPLEPQPSGYARPWRYDSLVEVHGFFFEPGFWKSMRTVVRSRSGAVGWWVPVWIVMMCCLIFEELGL